MRTKFIPMIVMLLAGFVTCVITILDNSGTTESLIRILIALIIFYIVGYIARKILEKVLKPKQIGQTEVSENENENKEESETNKIK